MRAGFQATNPLDADQLTFALLGVDVSAGGQQPEKVHADFTICSKTSIVHAEKHFASQSTSVARTHARVCCARQVTAEEAKLMRTPTVLSKRVGDDSKSAEMKDVVLIQASFVPDFYDCTAVYTHVCTRACAGHGRLGQVHVPVVPSQPIREVR